MTGLDVALARIAVVLRLLGAVWIVLLATTSALTGQLAEPVASFAVTAVAVMWALVAWRTGAIESARQVGIASGLQGRGAPVPVRGMAVLGADLLVTVGVIVVPGLLGETAGFAGGYPFACLLVALAVAGRRGVVVAAAVLGTATVANLASVGSPSLSDATSNVLLYGFGAAALVLGLEVIARQEARTRAAEADLVVAQERAHTAAHLHDSVLQTLALVQRRAEDTAAVRSLVRRQERELREWLFPDQQAQMGLGALLESHAEDVLERYGVLVRVVCSGGVSGLPVPSGAATGLSALVGAAREAMVNAAVHSGASEVDVYAEVSAGQAAVYVRDRGVGFDPATVGGDRQGLRGSIIERMDRAGGVARIRSSAGRGTEVELRAGVPGGGGRDG